MPQNVNVGSGLSHGNQARELRFVSLQMSPFFFFPSPFLGDYV